MATGINSTYNILGAGGDNIGQLRTIGSTTTRYYYLKDHLGTVKMEIKADGTIDSYNDYYPYGSIMPIEARYNLQIRDTNSPPKKEIPKPATITSVHGTMTA